jgi:hypothetical protein
MDIYNLGDVTSTTDGRGAFFHSFDIYGVHGRPIVSFSFEARQEADAGNVNSRTNFHCILPSSLCSARWRANVESAVRTFLAFIWYRPGRANKTPDIPFTSPREPIPQSRACAAWGALSEYLMSARPQTQSPKN